ncbi:MAG TPA: acetolactate synthase [Bacteroidaceae bacterium]|nr:acetolactate synthase [Bacteroidaceae bacterium]
MKTIKQLSVFLENQKGKLGEILKALSEEKIQIQAASVADTSDYGILRLITSDQYKAMELFRAKGVLTNVNEVLAIKVSATTGDFANAVKILTDGDVGINYLYTFHHQGKLVLIVRPDDLNKAIKIAENQGLELIKGWE